VFVNLPWELAKKIAQHSEKSYKRRVPTSKMDVFVFLKLAKFSDFTRHWNLYRQYHARTQLFTRQFVDDPTKQEVVALAPWPLQLRLVDTDCVFYDSARQLLLPYMLKLHRYMYQHTSLHSLLPRFDIFPRTLPPC
jgi:hypothetical protein